MEEHSRVYAKIDLDAVEYNFKNMRANIRPGTKLIAVVKTNAYGHGAVEISRLVEKYDYVWGFAVATTEEGIELRRAGIRKPVLILGYVFPEDYDVLVREQFRPAVFKLSMAKELDDAASRAGMIAPVHIAVDTGMTRIGFQVNEENADIVKEIASLPHLKIEGMFTHFAKADEKDKTYAREQFEKFRSFTNMLEERGVKIPFRHVSNSACIQEIPEFELDGVRAGITIYGIYPSKEVDRSRLLLRPVMELVSHIAYIKQVPAGTPVSYGGTYVTSRPTRIATIPVGYGDGYPRMLSNKTDVLIGGRRAKQIGRICMDQFMVDVTGLDAEEGQKVTLLGKDGDKEITVDELGELSGRFPYEFVCDISPRVPRIYIHS